MTNQNAELMPTPGTDALMCDHEILIKNFLFANQQAVEAAVIAILEQVYLPHKKLERELIAVTTTPQELIPIDMILFCPSCNEQHIDQPQPEKDWTNPPHKTHECQFCGYLWRVSDHPTNGVADIKNSNRFKSRPKCFKTEKDFNDAVKHATTLPQGDEVERAARAIYRVYCESNGLGNEDDDFGWEHHIDEAKAAIAAIRPSEVERVARAICLADNQDPNHLLHLPTEYVNGWTLYVEYAKAAIAAIRQPTKGD